MAHPRIRHSKTHKYQRGSALLLALGLLFVLAISAAGLMAMVNNTMRMAKQRTEMTEAFNMADSGLDLAMIWLSQQSSPPDNSQLHPMPNFFGTTGTINNPFGSAPGSTLSVRISPDTTNGSNTQKHYIIESQAIMPSGATQIVRAYVQQASFGKYAYFTVNDGGGFWDYNNHFEGPFHSNDADGQQTMIMWKKNNTADPMFTYTGEDAFSVSGNVTWWQGSIGTVVPPASTTDYHSIATGGQASMTTGFKTDVNGNFILDVSNHKIPNSAQIPLPTTDYTQQYASLGITPPSSSPTSGSAAAPTTAGVTVPNASGSVKGGIYIHGDNAMTLQVDASGNQQIVVVQGTTTQTITLDVANNTTKLVTVKTSPASTTTLTYSGLPNGMVYSDGNITALQGTVADNTVDGSGNITRRSQMTIATDIAAGKDVTLTGSVKYKTTRDLTKSQALDTTFNQKAGTLGILSRHVTVKDGAGPTLEFDGSIFATQTFDAQNYGNPPASSHGTMISVGGVITRDSGLFATANSDGSLRTGYQEQYHYDTRLADYPPPYFPTTGNHYDVLSWQRMTNLL